MKCEARREDPRHSRAHGEAAKAREQRQEPPVPGRGQCVRASPGDSSRCPISPLRSKARGQQSTRGERGSCAIRSDCGDPWSEPAAGPEWVGTSGEPRGGCEAPANPNPGRKIVHHPQAMRAKEPGASQGSFPARWGQPRARWAELSWQSQSIQDSLPFLNPVCSDKKPKRRAKNK